MIISDKNVVNIRVKMYQSTSSFVNVKTYINVYKNVIIHIIGDLKYQSTSDIILIFFDV